MLVVMAAFAGVLLLSLTIFSGKPLPSLLAELLMAANPFSFSVIIFGYALPAVFGVGVSIFIIKIIKEKSPRSMRILTFLNASVITFFLYSVATVEETTKNIPYGSNRSASPRNICYGSFWNSA